MIRTARRRHLAVLLLALSFTGCAPYSRGWDQEREVLGNYWSNAARANQNGNNLGANLRGGWDQEKTNNFPPVESAIRMNRREWHAYRDR